MKLIEMKCKNCGAKLKIESEAKSVRCQFCGTEFKIDDEVQHHKLENAEQMGYEFEKGKIRARQEAQQERIQEQRARQQAQYEAERKKNNLKWWIIGWIFCFPIPLTILIWKSKWDKKKKIIATSVLWIFIMIFMFVNPGNPTSAEIKERREKINETFVEKYNEISSSKIENITTYNAQDKESPYYRDEFNSSEYKINDSIHGSIENTQINLISYGYSNTDKFRFYADTNNDEEMKNIFRYTINILDNEITNDEINESINRAIKYKNEIINIYGNIKRGHITYEKGKWEIFIESNTDFIKQGTKVN